MRSRSPGAAKEKFVVVDAGKAQADGGELLGRGIDVHATRGNLAAGKLLDEGAGDAGYIHAPGLVDLTLEAE